MCKGCGGPNFSLTVNNPAWGAPGQDTLTVH